ncbi:rhomboid family intramembrane serine protease [Pontibacter sp. BT310]|jgi:membrane associated rhomboid family serine protease|uniref:Rhomboid family intramembrane serine protease n=1 Tax=Pontibacter populi TaxID=890055 RepID=A0ABS6XGC8_9BACT|nr:MULTISPECIES: rhomboid family intramembrane serine protease [Pontibacter]MBJ6119317.1 rhomboid family intramembrane serine protease [Pontibacter sp. BT310]MBR0571745.1 rhomboid family intramembrane serine protease [Microvirga sp. STS03]MBW3366171.1 rhomboid family intramembrane serine protease [Pontibacter populi]
MSILQDIKDAFRQPNNTLKQLILINVIVFVVLIVLRLLLTFTIGPGAYNYLMSFVALHSDMATFITRPWTLISYFFTHQGFLHIIFNMLNLYWFGQLIREYLGDKKLLSLYVIGGIAGGVLYMLSYNFIPYFEDRAASSVMIGASASVLAIVVAAATLLPNYTFNLILIGPVRIKYIALFLVLLSISGAVGDNAGGNIAHLGGALIGWLFIKQLQRGSDMGRPLHAMFDFFGRLFSRRPEMKVTHRKNTTFAGRSNGSTTTVTGKPSQKEIDLILDKISSSGYESLSKEEKQKLFQASQKE